VYFDQGDVVRHQLVQRIIQAYDEHKEKLVHEQMALMPDSKVVPKSNGVEDTVREKKAASTGEDSVAD
jgi:hypothetical protein